MIPSAGRERRPMMKKAGKVLKKTVGVLGAVYAGLFVVFYFDLDGKLLFNVVEPLMIKRFDSMERRDPLSVPYEQLNSEYMK